MQCAIAVGSITRKLRSRTSWNVRSRNNVALASFSGVGRRFELVGGRAGVRVIDDYGHNPTEIAAALRTARELEPSTLIAVYQPHVYERTRQLHHELGQALGVADAAVVTDADLNQVVDPDVFSDPGLISDAQPPRKLDADVRLPARRTERGRRKRSR